MNTIKILDKEFAPYLSQEEIEGAIQKVTDKINNDMKDKNPLFLVMLNGAFMFAAQLFKGLTIDCEMSFVKYCSYTGTQSTNQINELIGVSSSVEGRNVVIVEDIIDSGFTMSTLIKKLEDQHVASFKIATMLFKPNAFKFNYNIDYIGLSIPNDFIVGYGLDYNQYGRNYKEIYKIVE